MSSKGMRILDIARDQARPNLVNLSCRRRLLLCLCNSDFVLGKFGHATFCNYHFTSPEPSVLMEPLLPATAVHRQRFQKPEELLDC